MDAFADGCGLVARPIEPGFPRPRYHDTKSNMYTIKVR